MSKVVSVSKFPSAFGRVAAGGLVLMGVVAAMRFTSAPVVSAPAVKSPVVAPSSAANKPYTASRFPGVQVRQVPQEASPAQLPEQHSLAKRDKVWLGKRRGTVLPRDRAASPFAAMRTPPLALRSGRGTTALGGNWIAMPSERVPLSVARRKKSGQADVDCLVPHVQPMAPSGQ